MSDRRPARPASLALLTAVLSLTGVRASVSAQTPITIGESFTMRSAVLDETRRINVYVPPHARDSAGSALPVLYMLDGGLAEDFLHIAGLLQVSVGNGTMRPFMLVGIENTERRRDLTGPTTVDSDRRVAPRVGGSAAFRTFIRTELIPTVRQRYPVSDERALLGESFAGLFVVETFLTEPELFATYIAVDPSLWWNAGDLLARSGGLLRAHPDTPTTLFLASSDQAEIAAQVRQLGDSLARAGPAVRWRLEAMPTETHATIFHPAALRAIRKLFPVRSP